MPVDPQDTSYQDRLVALKLLRENMFYANPKAYAYTDIAEDFPGTAKAVAPILKNVLPSAAIISSNPEERSKQIDAAIEKIKATKKSKGSLLGEMWDNVKHLTPEAMRAGALFSAVPTLLGMRYPWARNAAGKLRPQIPIAPISAIKKFFTTKSHIDPNLSPIANNWMAREKLKAHRKHFAKNVLENALMGGAYSAAAGVALPLFAGNYELSDKALQEAKEIMQKNPYITSLPASEMMSAIRQHKSEQPLSGVQRIKNTLLGTGLGTLTALPGAAVPALLSGAGRFSGNALGKLLSKLPNTGLSKVDKFIKTHANTDPLRKGVGSTITNRLKKDVPIAAAFGGGLGALSGALSSNNPLIDEYENIKSNQA